MKSVIANITLKIEGVPSVCMKYEPSYPWMVKLVDPCSEEGAGEGLNTSVLSFELPFFPNDQPEYVIPEYIFNWRTSQLKEAILRNNGVSLGIDLITFFAQTDALGNTVFESDPIYEPSHCRISSIIDHSSISKVDKSPHLNYYGFECIEVQYRNYVAPLQVCPWEVEVDNTLQAKVPQLSRSEIDRFLILVDNAMCSIPGVRDFENLDYVESHVIEIPMDIKTIRLRLENMYYTNKLSVIADIKQMMENCFKLKAPSQKCVAASELYEFFKGNLNAQKSKNKSNRSIPTESYSSDDYLDQRLKYSKQNDSSFWFALKKDKEGKWRGVSVIEQMIIESVNEEPDSSLAFDVNKLIASSTMCSTLSDRALILEILHRRLTVKNGSALVHKFMAAGGLRIITSWLIDSTTPALKNKSKQSIISRTASLTGPLLIRILKLLEKMPFDLSLVKESQVDKRIRKLKKSIDGNICNPKSLQALSSICGGLDPKLVQKATDNLFNTWKDQHSRGASISCSSPFLDLMCEIKTQLKTLKECESKGTRASWLEALDSIKPVETPIEASISNKETKTKQDAARKRSQELKEGQAFKEQAKKNRTERKKAMSEELAQEYKRERDAWKIKREKSKIKLLHRDKKVVDVATEVKARRVRWKDHLVTIHTYEIESNDTNEAPPPFRL